MALHRHKAIVAGLALTLTLGSTAAPAIAALSDESPTTDTDPNGVGAPMPADYDKSDFYEGTEGVRTFAKARSASILTPVSLSNEMKYFAQFESHGNYDQGLSYGDGYNAMGFYQFDRRYSLMGFIQQVYGYNSEKYSMFAGVLSHADTLSSSSYSMYDADTRQLTGLATDLNDAWHAAYAADPKEFSALQDAYAYNNYYLPVQSILLNKYGVDVRDRADCVKGLVWGMCNMFGSGGVRNYFNDANLNDDMTDRELVTALCDTVVNRVSYYCSSQPQYWTGWQNRYKKEKEICLAYIAEDEAEQAAADKGESPTPEVPAEPTTPETPAAPTTPSKAPSAPNKAPSAPAAPSTPADNNTANGTPQTPANGTDAADDEENQAPADSTDDVVDNGVAEQPSDTTDDVTDDTTDDATDDQNTDAQKGGSDATADKSEDKKAESTSDTKKGTKADAKKDDAAKDADEETLPQTGDISGMFFTGAAGLAVAGGSLVSLAKKRDEE